jgi:tyrosine-protein phosphatase SIW14
MRFLELHLRWPTSAIFLAAALATTAFAGPVVQGVGNFQKVDDHVYRGAQPTDEGFRNLAKLGIKTVVDLRTRSDRSLIEEKAVTAAGMHYIGVPMRGTETPPNESVHKVLALLEDATTGPVFVHCHRGADRTGVVIACYRIEHDHWTKDRALVEARSLGLSWLKRAFQRYVLSYRPRILGIGAPKTPDASAVAPASSTIEVAH